MLEDNIERRFREQEDNMGSRHASAEGREDYRQEGSERGADRRQASANVFSGLNIIATVIISVISALIAVGAFKVFVAF
jgi:hypothetical protein